MNKQIWVSVISLVTMTCFMIFTTVLYFKKSSMINHAQIFNSEYTDMGFELVDNHMYISSLENDSDKYTQKENYTFALNIKYKEQVPHTLRILMDFTKINTDDYINTKVYFLLSDQNKKEIVPKTEVNLSDNKVILHEQDITYSNNNYLYYIDLEFISIIDNINFQSQTELGNTLSAEIDYNS